MLTADMNGSRFAHRHIPHNLSLVRRYRTVRDRLAQSISSELPLPPSMVDQREGTYRQQCDHRMLGHAGSFERQVGDERVPIAGPARAGYRPVGAGLTSWG